MSTTRVRDERPAAVTAQREDPTGTGHAWAWFLGAAFVGGVLYFALPRVSVTQGAVFVAAGLAVPVALAIGIARNRPRHRAAWWLLLAAWVVYQAVARLRNLLFEPRPRALDREGLVAAIPVYLSRGGKHDGATYQLDSELLEKPPLEIRVVLFRAAREALANTRKHAEASNVRTELRQPNDGYLVRIIDDGRGFTPTVEGEPGHLGIVAMRDRVEMVGGWLRIDSAAGKGTTVEFWVPGPQALQGGA